MATPSDETKIFKPFLPPLQLCASAKIAVQLRLEFGLDALKVAFEEIQRGNPTTAEEGRDNIRRAKDSLLHIPAHLRGAVMDAVYGSVVTVYWKWYYEYHFGFREVECSFRFRSDGTVDAVKTTQSLVRIEKFDIRERFKLACVFCLEESVEALWAEMEASGQTEDLERSDEFIVNFWVGWLRERPLGHPLGTLIPISLRDLADPRVKVPRCSAFFPLLRPEDRQKCLHFLYKTSNDDFRFCFPLITRKEEEQLLSKGQAAFRLLRAYVLWPLQTTFLPTAAKLWDYMDDISFRKLLVAILSFKARGKDFNYSELFEGFWNASPPHLKESALDEPELRQKIDSFFDEKRRKRKYVED